MTPCTFTVAFRAQRGRRHAYLPEVSGWDEAAAIAAAAVFAEEVKLHRRPSANSQVRKSRDLITEIAAM